MHGFGGAARQVKRDFFPGENAGPDRANSRGIGPVVLYSSNMKVDGFGRKTLLFEPDDPGVLSHQRGSGRRSNQDQQEKTDLKAWPDKAVQKYLLHIKLKHQEWAGIDGPGYSSSFSTARNASCGTSTFPIWRIRFLPSFCFSSSFRLRLISPP